MLEGLCYYSFLTVFKCKIADDRRGYECNQQKTGNQLLFYGFSYEFHIYFPVTVIPHDKSFLKTALHKHLPY